MNSLFKFLAMAMLLLLVSTTATATAPTVTVETTGKQEPDNFYFNLTTNLDSNCLADWNSEKTTWEDFNGSDLPIPEYYLTASAGTLHGAKINPGDFTNRTIYYCCAETTYGQTDANATCGSYNYDFYYGSEAIAEVIVDVGVGSIAQVFQLVALLGIVLVVAIGAYLYAWVKKGV